MIMVPCLARAEQDVTQPTYFQNPKITLEESMETHLKVLEGEYEGFSVYHAGHPYYPRNFSRDALYAGLIAEDIRQIERQVLFSAFRQGKEVSPVTGEEPGKIHHEWPGVEVTERGERVAGYSTEYNACDTTALYIMSLRWYCDRTDGQLCKTQRENLLRAISYIERHLMNDLFYESPLYANAQRFALGATHWKDSGLPNRAQGPAYPVVYPIVQAMYIRAMRDAAYLLNEPKFTERAEAMLRELMRLFDGSLGGFPLALDERGPIRLVGSDSLHLLFFLEPGDLPQNFIERIVAASSVLETPYGYRTLAPVEFAANPYHTNTIWPFENAVIHHAAKKFGLSRVQKVSGRIRRLLAPNSFPEYFLLHGNEDLPQPAGSNPQLWTIAAQKYFLLLHHDQ